MFNLQISHSKYRTIYQGVDNETGCEIAWSSYLISKNDLPTKELLMKKLEKVKEITRDGQTDIRAKHILRVIHFEFRPNTSSITGHQFKKSRHNMSFVNATQTLSQRGIKPESSLSLNPKPEETEKLIVVTELTTTGSLREYLRKIQHPRLKVIKEWCLKILEAVSFLHENDIVHGKLTCESIYYNSNVAEIKIGDIGVKQVIVKAQNMKDE
jgi:serine/threonine protein kinase